MHHFLSRSSFGRKTASQPAALVPWYASAEYADLAAVADFKNWRFAVTEVLVGSVPGATAAQLKVKREATFDEFFAFTATSTAARSYTKSGGTLRTMGQNLRALFAGDRQRGLDKDVRHGRGRRHDRSRWHIDR